MRTYCNGTCGWCEEISQILQLHNEKRQKVANGSESKQPWKAYDMFELKWDAGLATKAQAWADNQVFKHDNSEEREKNTQFEKKGGVGQNIALPWSFSSTVPERWERAMDNWYGEVELLKASQTPPEYGTTKLMGKTILHYTQVVWAKTTHIGCGAKNFLVGQWWRSLVVCNYGPAGNMIRDGVLDMPYKTSGELCSDSRDSANYTNLCQH